MAFHAEGNKIHYKKGKATIQKFKKKNSNNFKICQKLYELSGLCQKSKKSPPEKVKVDVVHTELAFLRGKLTS